jgi:hypothetical protein
VHAPPQHSPDIAQLSPAGLHPPPAGAHLPAMQTSEQQSELDVHVSPMRAHHPSGEQLRSHFKEQHAPAYVHVFPAPRQPVVGRHVMRAVGSILQRPEQHESLVAHVCSSARQPPSDPDSTLASTEGESVTLASPIGGKRSTRRSPQAQRKRSGAYLTDRLRRRRAW